MNRTKWLSGACAAYSTGMMYSLTHIDQAHTRAGQFIFILHYILLAFSMIGLLINHTSAESGEENL